MEGEYVWKNGDVELCLCSGMSVWLCVWRMRRRISWSRVSELRAGRGALAGG